MQAEQGCACRECNGEPPREGQRQKQVDQALTRALEGRPPRGKCTALIANGQLLFYHYHHLLLAYDLSTRSVTYRWHVRPTDLRVLLAVRASPLLRQFPAC